MTNISYLQLYLDTDYLLPVAVGADGNLVKYQDKQGNCRLWLFFQKSSGRDAYESGASLKANYEAHSIGVLGDFWGHIENGDKVEGEPFGYEELLELGGLLDTVRNWCRPMLGTPTPQVVLNFATTIGLKARLTLVEYLQKKGFSIRSYSTEINDLMAEKVVHDHSAMQCSFGDQLLVLQSTGNLLLLSTMTWCGDVFLQGDKPTEIKRHGDDFKRTTLATMVVEKMERHNNKLLPHEVPNEISYQTQFADEWLKCRMGNVIWVRGFHYSRSPGKVYPPEQIDARQLDLLVEDNGREIIAKVERYLSENMRKTNHLHTIMLGDMFRDEIFCQNCVKATESPRKFTFFNDNALQEAMGRYYYAYGDLQEPVEELERCYLTMEQERERIRKYVKNAEILGNLRSTIDESSSETREAIDKLKSQTQQIEDSWTAYMRQSKFDDAEKVLCKMSSNEALTLAQSHLYDALVKVEANMSLLEDLKQLNEVHVREIVDTILQGYEKMQHLQTETKELERRPEELREKTRFFRNQYNVYIEKKREMDNELSLDGKRDLLKIIEKLTMEPLPKIDVRVVTAELTCKLQVVKSGFMGCKKEKFLNITMQVKNNDALAFGCVLMISDSKKVRVNRRAWCADLQEGDTHYETTIPVSALPESTNGEWVVQLLPDENNSHLTSRIYCDSLRITI